MPGGSTKSFEDRVRSIISAHVALDGPLLPTLNAVQGEFGYIPRETIPIVAEALNLSRAEVYGVVSFYHDFRDHAPAKRVVRLCRAEACQAMGANALAEKVLQHFQVDWGEATQDGISIEAVYCLGLCSVAPAALIDGAPRGRLDEAQLIAALATP